MFDYSNPDEPKFYNHDKMQDEIARLKKEKEELTNLLDAQITKRLNFQAKLKVARGALQYIFDHDWIAPNKIPSDSAVEALWKWHNEFVHVAKDALKEVGDAVNYEELENNETNP